MMGSYRNSKISSKYRLIDGSKFKPVTSYRVYFRTVRGRKLSTQFSNPPEMCKLTSYTLTTKFHTPCRFASFPLNTDPVFYST